MGRNKSELKSRDKYAELYASVLLAEAVVDHGLGAPSSTLKIESEEMAEWDDVVQKFENQHHRHQIKKQVTGLNSKEFAQYVKSINYEGIVKYHFAVPVPISVKSVGELRILKELCRRLQQQGANLDEVLDGLRPAEKKWLKKLKEWTKGSPTEVFRKLQCLHIDFIGFEPELKELAVRALRNEFRDNAQNVLDEICKYVSNLDGVVDITVEEVRKTLVSLNWPTNRIIFGHSNRGGGNRGSLIPNDSTVAADPSLPYSDVLDYTWLKDIFAKEVTTTLRQFDIFSKSRLEGSLSQVEKIDWFSVGKTSLLNSLVDQSLSKPESLGVPSSSLLGFPHISVAMPPTLATPAVIISYLQLQGFPISGNYNFSVTPEIVRRMQEGSLIEHCQGCILTTVAAGDFLRSEKESFLPLMLMPRNTHAVIATKDSKRILDHRSCEFALWTETMSGAFYHLEQLHTSGYLNIGELKKTHAASDEVADIMACGTDEVRSIQWFPFYDINLKYNDCKKIATPDVSSFGTCQFFFLHESLFREPGIASTINIAIRNAWLDLASNSHALELAVAKLLSNRNYLRNLFRFGGLHFMKNIFR